MNVFQKDIKINKRHIILLLVLNFLVLGFYYTYAVFVTRQLQENVAVLVTSGSGIEIISDSLVNNSIVVSSQNEKEINITLSNVTSSSLFYNLLHEKLPTGVMVYETSGEGNATGVIPANQMISLNIIIKNDTNEDVEVVFYCQISNEVINNKEMGYSYINNTPNYDHSGANYPVLNDMNAIPVYYEKVTDTTGVWKKADSSNNNSDAIWYDYDNGRWANIVLVNEYNRDRYLNSSVGTEIEPSDILAYFVWIPSFRYMVSGISSPINYERNINVIFEKSYEKHGTISCIDKVSSIEDNHIYSETCTDLNYGQIYENLSTYSHPAFGNNSLGFWIGKFQTSSNGTKIVPNAPSFNTTFDKAFELSRNYELNDNLYGINNQSSEIGEDGIIINDTNNLDSHLLKNMEWGAVAILSNSLYGKSGNSKYYTEDITSFKKIYPNTNNLGMYTGCSSNYNNSSNSFITTASASCVQYNDFSNYTHISNGVIYPIGDVGPGASTTGTIYGVYDMAGATQEMVSAIALDNTYEIPVAWDGIYYDLYSQNDYIGSINDSSNIGNLYRYKLGDGIREHYRTFDDNGMWHSGYLNQSNASGYLIRGGDYSSGRGASIFSSDIVPFNATSAYRVVIKY